MVYLDNAATTLIRPKSVIKAANKAMLNAAGYGAKRSQSCNICGRNSL